MPMRCAIVGSGNIGTDLMYKLLRSEHLELGAVVGIDPESDGLRLARDQGIEASFEGVDWLLAQADHYQLVFEATSAAIHVGNAPRYESAELTAIDLTPAKIGPAVIPPLNLSDHLEARNINLVTCGGQATAPIVGAVTRVTNVPYAEIVSTVASLSAGPGTRQNIDEFTIATGASLVEVGGARRGKAIIVLNPAEPPILMRNTVFCALTDGFDERAIAVSIESMVEEVASYVPGYRLKQKPIFDRTPVETPDETYAGRVIVLLEVEGAGDYLPTYAGNLDIMTAAAVRVGEALALAGVPA